MSGHCVVGSLSEYIAAIERYDLFHCISRGEQREFDHPLRCSIYRHDLDQYTRMLEQYHLDVETSISPIQDRNFLAFAQHHGLPTNLLDFSFSPLVSLFFCVDGCTGRGFVYFVRKEKLVNINKVLYDKPLGWGMFEELLGYDVDLLRSLLPQMSEVFDRNQEEMTEYFEHHARSLAALYRRSRGQDRAGAPARDAHAAATGRRAGPEVTEDFERMLRQYEEYRAGDLSGNTRELTEQMRSRSPSLIKSMQKILKEDPHTPSSFLANYRRVASSRVDGAKYSANIHVLMFLLKLEELECYNKTVIDPESPVYELEFPFYFMYRPPVIDDRVRNQYSVFIFQPFVAGGVIAEDAGANPGADVPAQDGEDGGTSEPTAGMTALYRRESDASMRRYLKPLEPEDRDGSADEGTARQDGESDAGDSRSGTDRTPVQVWQRISPDFTIEIQNPELIRRELDAIGINSKNIFCDYDSIAEYIVRTSEEMW